MIIGITGSSGSGKSLVSELLSKRLNANLICADEIVKKMQIKGNRYLEEIIHVFGKEILLPSGELDRNKLAIIVFQDSEKKQKLDKLTEKYVVEEVKQQIQTQSDKNTIIDAPLLIETKLNDYCDIVIAVISNKNLQIERICKRDKIDEAYAKLRLNTQQDNEFYIEHADYVIENYEGDLEEKVEKLLLNLKE